MQFSNLQFEASDSLADMLRALLAENTQIGKYLITLEGNEHSNQNCGVRPCQIIVRKESAGTLLIERLFECKFNNNKLELANSFDFLLNEYSFEYIGGVNAGVSLRENELAEVYGLFSSNIVCYFKSGLYSSVQITFINQPKG